ncbi:hypothetical protein K1719_005907 [Acacia pycnantha]|nr:hypothetical protein K1719_005907 [Acacia pycnantha]
MDALRTNRSDFARPTTRTNRSAAAHHAWRTTNRSHTPMLSNFSSDYHIPFMAMPPYPYNQSPHYHNFMIDHPFYYGLPCPYARSASIQRPLPPQDPELYPNIVRQIEYYFSEENLVIDTYLKNKMDKYGWVDVHVIAEFRRIKALTDDIHHILEALVFSSTVQVRAYKMKKKKDRYFKFPNPNS